MDADDVELDELIRIGRKYRWATGEVRRKLERAGINLVRTDFYADAPTLDDIDASFEYADDEGGSRPVFDDDTIFDDAALVEMARALMPAAADFAAPMEATAGFYWKNTQFSSLDAIAYHCMIRMQAPRVVIEIGSGNSTFVARAALDTLGGDRHLICIDPEPRADIASIPGVELIRARIQDVEFLELLKRLSAGDIVFYDGSHTLRTGSDTVLFYLKILPYLPSGLFVHAHDVNLPYPRNKKALKDAKLYWGEQYVLLAHLYNTSRYKVIFASHYLTRRHPTIAAAFLAERYPVYGCSLWYRII